MTTNNKSLRDEEVKLAVIGMRASGESGAEIGRYFDISPRAIQEFLARDTWKEWWEEYDEDQEEYLSGKGYYLDLAMKLKEDVKMSTVEKKLAVETKDIHSLKILVIADTQCKPSESLDYMKWIGKYIFDKKPDVVVHIGDCYDVPSLSSYDKGKKSFEGRRLKADLEAGTRGLELLLAEFQKDDYNPRMVFCLGNHEERIDRLANDMPELEGFVGTDLLPLASMGWEVQPFLKPIEIEGIFFVHYLANPFTGKPFAGTALSQLKTVGRSFVVGHKQCLDVAIRPTIDGKHQIGIINGAAYDFDEAYKGPQLGNNHFRGITMLHEVKDGFGLPSFISLDYLKSKYKEGL